ncbi:MAG: glutamate-5-semialdehyde dehydrogenase [Clostridiales bacterium]|nr:glutamate-5-semialdehyde dehydrogenase [Clostridiales bacterium]
MTREELIKVCAAARRALPCLIAPDTREKMLSAIADALVANKDEILAANSVDIPLARESGISEVMIDRLRLTPDRLEDIAKAVREVAALPDPLVPVSETVRPNGLKIVKHRVPFGVIAMIYESRPNVTVDAAAICLKSGNAVILRGGREAFNSNMALVKVIRGAITPFGAHDAVNLITDTDRESVDALLSLRGHIDLLIPRGGAGLIRKVVDNAKVPVIETGTGNCHVYVHSSADLDMAQKIIINAKTSRPSVCNAAETLLCDREIAPVFLPMAARALRERGVELRVCPESMKYIPDATPATEEDYYTEFLDYILAIKVVSGVDEAVEHINKYGTMHSEAIVAEDEAAVRTFMSGVDASSVYHNASTRFTDGGVFGMGAEIGISTQKLHVRGPFALEGLTTMQYRVYGNGQVR